MKSLKIAVVLAALMTAPFLAAASPAATVSVQALSAGQHLSMSMVSSTVLSSFHNQNSQGGNNNNQGGNNNNQGGGVTTIHGAEMSKTAILLAGLLAISVFWFVRRTAHKRS